MANARCGQGAPRQGRATTGDERSEARDRVFRRSARAADRVQQSKAEDRLSRQAEQSGIFRQPIYDPCFGRHHDGLGLEQRPSPGLSPNDAHARKVR